MVHVVEKEDLTLPSRHGGALENHLASSSFKIRTRLKPSNIERQQKERPVFLGCDDDDKILRFEYLHIRQWSLVYLRSCPAIGRYIPGTGYFETCYEHDILPFFPTPLNNCQVKGWMFRMMACLVSKASTGGIILAPSPSPGERLLAN
jgi:hypothetical protein